jgi:hypothetical protein
LAAVAAQATVEGINVLDFGAGSSPYRSIFPNARYARADIYDTKGIDYVMWGGVAVTVLLVERTPDLMRLEESIVDAVTPFSVSGGTAAAFVGADANPDTVAYVETFVPKSSGKNYIPHVTAGVAREAFVKQLKAEPFQAFTFKPDGVAIYQLGNFGTASKKLWQSVASPRGRKTSSAIRVAARGICPTAGS